MGKVKQDAEQNAIDTLRIAEDMLEIASRDLIIAHDELRAAVERLDEAKNEYRRIFG